MAKSSIVSRAKSAWNIFMNKDPTEDTGSSYSYGTTSSGYYSRPDRHRLGRAIDRTIVNAVYNRIALDVAAIDIRHVRLRELNGGFLEYMDSDLDQCLSLEANIDQTSRAFKQDIALSMMDEGCVAVVPIDTTSNPDTGSYDIETMRVARIVEWYPTKVKVEAYNDRTGKKQQIVVNKVDTAIMENPFYSVMNEPNSTMQRLIRKLSLLDVVDEQSSSGKLDLIIQLPYTIKTDARRAQAEERIKLIEKQLSADNKYGIAYADATEKITQLNRSIENNLLKQVEYLTNLLFSQLGITQEILNGTADEATMMNYYSRTIDPFVAAIADEMKRKFLTQTARSQKQSIEYYRDPFKLVPVSSIAEIADKFTRNEIMTSNEIRQTIGLKPVDDPKADKLVNSNLNQSKEEFNEMTNNQYDEEEFQNE